MKSAIRDTALEPGSPALRPAIVYALFTISGACGLAYQVLWARWLSLLLGSTTASVSIVLSSFMLGLALGSWAAGRTLPRVRRPLRVFGLLEAGIGLVALCFPLLTEAAERLLTAVVDTDSPRPLALAARAGFAFALLLVPTTLMGATLPQLTDLMRRIAPPGRSWRLGVLYALNTTGATLGSLVVSFLGIELLGIRGTTLVAAMLNLGVGLLALRADARLPDVASTAAHAPRRSGSIAALSLGVLFASGAAALAGEVLWTRWLEVLVGNSSYAFALMLVVYLAGIAAGAALPSLVIARLRRLEGWLIATQLAAAGWLLAAVPLFDRLARSLSTSADVELAMPALLGLYARAALLLLPGALLSGAVFPLATRLLSWDVADASGQVAARGYAWNTLGAVFGALVGGWVIAPRFDFAEAVLVLGVGYAAIGLVAGAALLFPALAAPRALAAALIVAALVLGTAAAAAERARGGYAARLLRRYPTARVLFHDRGAQGITTVLAPSSGDRFRSVLLVNATGMTRLATATKVMAHLPLLAHPRPDDTLVICFGMGTTFRSAMSHGGRVTAVELVGEVLDAFPTFHPDAEELRRDPRGRLVVDDGRSFVRLTRQRFDVITIDPPPPIDGAGVNSLYSLDFLRLARSRLAPGGVMAHWIPYPATNSGVADWTTFSMLVRSFTDAFPYTASLPGIEPVGLHVLGSDRPIALTAGELQSRLARGRAANDLDEWRPVPRNYLLSLRPLDPRSLAAFPPVTDDRPRLEFDLIRLWRAGGSKPFHRIYW